MPCSFSLRRCLGVIPLLRFTSLILGCACAAVALTGCVAYQPRPLDTTHELDMLRHTEVVPVTMEHAALGAGQGGSRTPAFDATDGLSEPEVVAIALSLNPELRATRAKIGEASAGLISAGIWPNPEVGVGWRGGIGGASGYTLDADLLFELLRPGERDVRHNVATARTDEARAEMVAAEYRVAADARQRWLAVLAAEQVAVLLNEEVNLRNRAVELVQRKRGLGEATELDLAAASLEAAEVRRERRRADAELETARRELNRSLGLPPSYKLPLTDSGKPIHVVVYDDVDRCTTSRGTTISTAACWAGGRS
jgi:outer membrane protein, heavy metal efflux system